MAVAGRALQKNFRHEGVKNRIRKVFRGLDGKGRITDRILAEDVHSLSSLNGRINRILRAEEITSKDLNALNCLLHEARVLLKDISARQAKLERKDVFAFGKMT
jgi:hypothetical protein